MCEPVKIQITVETEQRDYKTGDYLNAVDELTCYFARTVDQGELSAALKMYAENNLK